MADERYNRKNPAVKRILQEVKEMQANPSDDFMSLPLEENIFEWQFAIRGPSETEFEGGIYHGRIQLPSDYPFKPPSFLLLTPSGRFETNTKICLSISNYHPEHWQPSWSVRTALVALIAFMPSNPSGAIGSVDYPKEERRALATKSRESPPKYGSPERQKVIDEIHQYMLSKTPSPKPNPEECNKTSSADSDGQSQTKPQDTEAATAEPVTAVEENGVDQIAEEAGQTVVPGANAGENVAAGDNRNGLVRQREQATVAVRAAQRRGDDRLFTWAAVGLTIAIVVLLLKKLVRSSGHGALFMDES
ncbi:PREDICTED: ubiquitin-conjugating enzyme E2 32-like [Brassica oleracea var. oleracea]|uniref:UBC core domain-containing protein n=1 Tax=Brassica oleracea var. oleracea TaxID=109376 RepID=A0A0D3A7Q0_BRAOL|nr:PREDICTED: ubiquitin-conjugating enzyme E2 32-like [Brassica oleracea var. oleracea]